MPEEHPAFEAARPLIMEAKRQVLERFSNDSNVLGGGMGRRVVNDEFTDTPALVVYVARKMSTSVLPASATLPSSIDVHRVAVQVDVIETGPFYAYAYILRERPAPSGISIGHPLVTAGTLGCLVKDTTDNAMCILSNNHVLANENKARNGDAALQPGTIDGGTLLDRIGFLKRFIPINFGGTNRVDCAIAQVDDSANVVDDMKGPMSRPEPGQAAVGLLFAGSCARTLCCDINEVASRLQVEMTAGSSARSNSIIGGQVQKTGRTTELTNGRIYETGASASIVYDGGVAKFDGLIATSPMSAGGDSGSVVCYGGSGVTEIPCSDAGIGGMCASTAAAANLTSLPLTQDLPEIRQARDKYLAQTRIGAWAIAVFEKNEHALRDRAELTVLSEEDRELARALYSRYSGDAKLALADPDRDDLRVTQQHIDDARVVLRRTRAYATDEEYAAGEKLMKLAPMTLGKNPRELLKMLNDDGLFQRVRAIVSNLRTLNTNVPIN